MCLKIQNPCRDDRHPMACCLASNKQNRREAGDSPVRGGATLSHVFFFHMSRDVSRNQSGALNQRIQSAFPEGYPQRDQRLHCLRASQSEVRIVVKHCATVQWQVMLYRQAVYRCSLSRLQKPYVSSEGKMIHSSFIGTRRFTFKINWCLYESSCFKSGYHSEEVFGNRT